jgi:HprK-related kinase B
MNLTAAALIADLRRRHPTDQRLDLFFEECRIAVYAGRQDLLDALADYYGPFVSRPQTPDITITVHDATPPDIKREFTIKKPDPGKTKIKEAFLDLPDGRIVKKRLTGMLFVFGGGEHLAIGACRKNLNQVVNFINNRHIEWQLCRRSLLGHAAAVALNGRGLALAGFSGAGKSTLALHVMGCGADFISNDRLMISKTDTGLDMCGVAKMPRINPGTILHNPALTGLLSEQEKETFSALEPDELRQLEHKFDAPIETCFGPGRFKLKAPMTALAILNWQSNGEPVQIKPFRASERPDLLPAFMKSTGLFYLPDGDCRMPDPVAASYSAYLDRVALWEFSGGIDFEAATAACCRYLEQGDMAI